MGEFFSFLQNNLADFWTYTGFHNATLQHVVMILVGIFFIYLAVAKEFEPMLLIPIGFGILIGNIPFNMEAGAHSPWEKVECLSCRDTAFFLKVLRGDKV